MSAPSDPRPCQGDAYVQRTPLSPPSCFGCRHKAANAYGQYHHEVCTGDDYRFLALAALEVATERAETLRLTAVAMRQNGADRLGGTVTDITLYPGPDPRLVQDDWGWER